MKLAITLIFIALGGCATSQWVRPDTAAEQTDRDDMACQRWARTEASNRASGFYDGPVLSQRSISRPEQPLDSRGYRTYDEVSLTDFCMRSRGYQRAP